MLQQTKTFKIDSYDFFGYLAPGLLVFISGSLAVLIIKFERNLLSVLKLVVTHTEKLSTPQAIACFVAITVTSYVLGHLTGSISSYILDKIIIKKIIGYPYNKIIFDKTKTNDFQTLYYKTIVTMWLISVLLFCVNCDSLTFSLCFFDSHYTMKPYCTVAFLALCFTIFKAIDTPLRRNFKKTHCIYRFIFMLMFRILSLPFSFVQKLENNFAGERSPLPSASIDQIHKKYYNIFKTPLQHNLQGEVFWSIYWYVTSTNTYARDKTDKWMVLYSFMRNLSCACLLASIILAFPLHYCNVLSSYLRITTFTLLVFALIFSFRYHYLYYAYYSKTIFRFFSYPHFHEGKDSSI